jgi:hypothetical protein
MSAVQARIHYAMKEEFRLLKRIIADYTPEEYSYDPVEGPRRAKKSDYDDVEVIPVSDPNAATMSQKVVQYQAVMQMAAQNPQIYDMVELNRQMLEVLGIKNIGKLIPSAEDQKPKDPVSENMALLNMKPVKAFVYQDHEAHIAVHTSAMQDPKMAQIIGQNPQAQTIMAAAMAHINEHVAFQYRKEIEEQLGIPLPKMDEEMEPEMEQEISRMMAAAAIKLLQKDQGEAQAQQAQQAAQDPIVQMQQQELQIKAQEVEIKKQKLLIDGAEKQDRIRIEEERIAAQKEIAGMQLGAKVGKDKAELEARQTMEGARMGAEVARTTAQMAQQERVSIRQMQQSNKPKKGE